MKGPSTLGDLSEELVAEKLRHLHVHGFLVIDANALPVASTFYNPTFEQYLCGLGGRALEILKQVQRDFGFSENLYLWLASVERNLVVIPVAQKFFLIAVCDATASPAMMLIPLLAFGQRLATRILLQEVKGGC